MGGPPLISYDVMNKRLVPNGCEAWTVRWLFVKLIELQSVTELKSEADRSGTVSKIRFKLRSGQQYGGTEIPCSQDHT